MLKIFIITLSLLALAEEPISLFGSKPIQLGLENGKVVQKKEGWNCNLKAFPQGDYTQWGETEKDARLLVKKECDNKSGLLLCDKEKITCKKE